eukprot:77811_1
MCDIYITTFLRLQQIQATKERNKLLENLELKYANYINSLMRQKVLIAASISLKYDEIIHNINDAIYNCLNNKLKTNMAQLVMTIHTAQNNAHNQIYSKNTSHRINTTTQQSTSLINTNVSVINQYTDPIVNVFADSSPSIEPSIEPQTLGDIIHQTNGASLTYQANSNQNAINNPNHTIHRLNKPKQTITIPTNTNYTSNTIS